MDVSQIPGPVVAFAVIGLFLVIWAVMTVSYFVGARLSARFTRTTTEKESVR